MMKTTLGLIPPQTAFQAYLFGPRGEHYQHHITHKMLRAREIYEQLQRAQAQLYQESLIALIADSTLVRASHSEFRHLDELGLPVYCYREYSELTGDLRCKTSNIWKRAEFSQVR